MIKYFIALILFLSSPVLADSIKGKIVKITDGDTVHLLDKNMTINKIRLAGIDAPERKQPFGNKAKQYLSDLVGAKVVTVDFNKRDRYKRIVGKIIYQGTDINLEMVKSGLAWHYKKYQNEQTVDERLSYAVAENNARKFKTGLWNYHSPTAPWTYRKQRRKNNRS